MHIIIEYMSKSFSIKLTTTYVDIEYSKGIVKKGSVAIDMHKGYVYIFFWRDKSWRWWRGSKSGASAKLTIKFNDAKHMITVNSSDKIIFHRPKDYNEIKAHAIYYKLMSKNDNQIEFRKST